MVGFDADDEGKKTIATRGWVSEWGFTDEKMIWVVVLLLLLLFLWLDCRLWPIFISLSLSLSLSTFALQSHASTAAKAEASDRIHIKVSPYMYIRSSCILRHSAEYNYRLWNRTVRMSSNEWQRMDYGLRCCFYHSLSISIRSMPNSEYRIIIQLGLKNRPSREYFNGFDCTIVNAKSGMCIQLAPPPLPPTHIRHTHEKRSRTGHTYNAAHTCHVH